MLITSHWHVSNKILTPWPYLLGKTERIDYLCDKELQEFWWSLAGISQREEGNIRSLYKCFQSVYFVTALEPWSVLPDNEKLLVWFNPEAFVGHHRMFPFIICLILMNYLMEFYFIGFVNAHLPGCFCPWTFRLNIGLNTSPSDSFVSYLNSHLGYSAGEFQALCNWLSLRCLVPWINHLPPVCWSTFGILVWNDSGYVNLTQWWYFFIIFEYILHISTPHIMIFCFPLPYFPLSTSALFFA